MSFSKLARYLVLATTVSLVALAAVMRLNSFEIGCYLANCNLNPESFK